jgi:site-specific DNA-cytosine methylase
MLSDFKFAAWSASRRGISVVIFAVVLFGGHYVIIQILSWRGINEGATLIDDFAIAALGGAALWFFLTLQAERQGIAHARERLIVTARLNHQIRHAMSAVATSVVLPNEEDRLRLVDEAVERIDHVLMDLVPTADEQDRVRFYLEQSR